MENETTASTIEPIKQKSKMALDMEEMDRKAKRSEAAKKGARTRKLNQELKATKTKKTEAVKEMPVGETPIYHEGWVNQLILRPHSQRPNAFLQVIDSEGKLYNATFNFHMPSCTRVSSDQLTSIFGKSMVQIMEAKNGDLVGTPIRFREYTNERNPEYTDITILPRNNDLGTEAKSAMLLILADSTN